MNHNLADDIVRVAAGQSHVFTGRIRAAYLCDGAPVLLIERDDTGDLEQYRPADCQVVGRWFLAQYPDGSARWVKGPRPAGPAEAVRAPRAAILGG